MNHLKIRVFALFLIILGAGLVYISWHQLWRDGTYYLKLAAFGPVVAIGGLFLLVFPDRVGKPNTTLDKVIVFVVLGIGLLAGVVNVYLMDPGMFGR